MTKLTTYIIRKNWNAVLKRINSNSIEVTKCDKHGFLPIHHACRRDFIPVRIIEALIEVHPESVMAQSKETSGAVLPLHCAVNQANTFHSSLVNLLVKKYPEGVAVKNLYGRTPLHSYLRCSPNPSLEITKLLLDAYPNVIRIRDDKFHWYPLHCAATRNNWKIVQYLIDVYPDAIMKIDHKTRTPRNVAAQYYQQHIQEKLKQEEKKT